MSRADRRRKRHGQVPRAQWEKSTASPPAAPLPARLPPRVAPVLLLFGAQAVYLILVVWMAHAYPGRLEKLWAPESKVVLVLIPGAIPRAQDALFLQALAKERSIAYLAARRSDVPSDEMDWFLSNSLPGGPILTPGLGIGDGSLDGLLGSVGLDKLASPPWVVIPSNADTAPFTHARMRVIRLGDPKPQGAPEQGIFGARDWNEARKILETSR